MRKNSAGLDNHAPKKRAPKKMPPLCGGDLTPSVTGPPLSCICTRALIWSVLAQVMLGQGQEQQTGRQVCRRGLRSEREGRGRGNMQKGLVQAGVSPGQSRLEWATVQTYASKLNQPNGPSAEAA